MERKINKVIFYANASKLIGFGHFFRCKAIMEEFICRGFNVEWLFKSCPSELLSSLEKENIKHTRLPEDQVISLSSLDQINGDVLVVDDYFISSEEWNVFESYRDLRHEPILVVLDDLTSKYKFNADIIINHSRSATIEDYKWCAQDTELLLGIQYTYLRNEFTVAIPIQFEMRKGVALSLGGADPLDLSLPLVEIILDTISTERVYLILNKEIGAQAHLKLEKLLELHDNLVVITHIKEMAKFLAHIKYFITAAGTSLNEAGCLGVPCFALITADNQIPALESLSEKINAKTTWYNCFDFREFDGGDVKSEVLLQEFACHFEKTWNNQQGLKALSVNGLNTIDGQGCVRIVDAITSRTNLSVAG